MTQITQMRKQRAGNRLRTAGARGFAAAHGGKPLAYRLDDKLFCGYAADVEAQPRTT